MLHNAHELSDRIIKLLMQFRLKIALFCVIQGIFLTCDGSGVVAVVFCFSATHKSFPKLQVFDNHRIENRSV